MQYIQWNYDSTVSVVALSHELLFSHTSNAVFKLQIQYLSWYSNTKSNLTFQNIKY